ncbi:MAG: class I SAM-dependent rRNA methyltransferase [Anaerolineaceae bacterium]|nr:class I SAM-dependent rRNA methyltransferase [Anaerolineaceae bacterium]
MKPTLPSDQTSQPKRNMAVRVTETAETMIRKRHPWIFDQSITFQSHAGAAGDLAVIFDSHRKFLALGLWDPDSVIRIRILQFSKQAEIDQEWFAGKIRAAYTLREVLHAQHTDGYRLVFGENDGLPGLVIDRYSAVFVIKIYSAAWVPYLLWITECLHNMFSYRTLVIRLSRNIAEKVEAAYGIRDGTVLDGEPVVERALFRENGLIFEADPIHGHKTGFYLDQRENRARVEQLAAGKSVLNVFSYNGGFSLYAARGKAKAVTSVDLNPLALESARRNFDYNLDIPGIKACQHETVVADAFQYLQKAASNQQKFDLVILDPPMFAQNQSQIDRALATYQKLTRLGLGVLKPGGVLVQASCSSRVSAPVFFDAIHAVVQRMGRKIYEIERSGHALDHPVNFPEGAYLKCLFARIE